MVGASADWTEKNFTLLCWIVGNEVKMGAIINDDGKSAQEYLELIKLRFEQVGFSNPTVWVGKLPDSVERFAVFQCCG